MRGKGQDNKRLRGPRKACHAIEFCALVLSLFNAAIFSLP